MTTMPSFSIPAAFPFAQARALADLLEAHPRAHRHHAVISGLRSAWWETVRDAYYQVPAELLSPGTARAHRDLDLTMMLWRPDRDRLVPSGEVLADGLIRFTRGHGRGLTAVASEATVKHLPDGQATLTCCVYAETGPACRGPFVSEPMPIHDALARAARYVARDQW